MARRQRSSSEKAWHTVAVAAAALEIIHTLFHVLFRLRSVGQKLRPQALTGSKSGPFTLGFNEVKAAMTRQETAKWADISDQELSNTRRAKKLEYMLSDLVADLRDEKDTVQRLGFSYGSCSNYVYLFDRDQKASVKVYANPDEGTYTIEINGTFVATYSSRTKCLAQIGRELAAQGWPFRRSNLFRE